MAHSATLSILTAESGLTRYLKEVSRLPMLEPPEEYVLATRWREQGDREVAHRLVTSHTGAVSMAARQHSLQLVTRRLWADNARRRPWGFESLTTLFPHIDPGLAIPRVQRRRRVGR